MIEITVLPIDVARLISAATHTSAGGLNVFIGTIRDNNASKGKIVNHLEYEAYDAMAISEIQKIADQAVAQFGIKRWAISHRTGIVKPGEIAVVIAVSTAHRKESFEACQFIINELKSKVPIWKKEVFEDGEEWVSARP
jgi:molybdopterin synthase catalytic subunit